MYIKSFTKVMDDAVDIVHESKSDMMLANFVRGLVLMGFIVSAVIVAMIVGAVASLASSILGGIIAIVGMAVAVVFVVAVINAGTGSMIVLTDNAYRNKFMTVSTAIGAGLRRIPALMGYAVFQILGLIPLGLIVVLAIYLVGGGVDSMTQFQSLLYNPAGVMGLVLLICIVLVAVISISLACYQTFFIFGVAAIVLDGLGPVAAFKKNWRLVKDELKEMIAKVILIELGTTGINLCFTMLLVLIGVILGLICFWGSTGSDVTTIQTVATLIEWPIRIIFGLLFLAINPAVVSVFYYSQKCKKEGADLMERLQIMKKRSKEEKQNIELQDVKENGDGINGGIEGGI